MLKSLKSTLFFLLAICTTSGAFAHALWIETNVNGKPGAAHEVKVFYGEYASGERDSVSKWYSDVKDFSLWLTAPGKAPVKLATKAGVDFYSATFIPADKGHYILTVVHEAKELGGTTKYEFSSNAVVNVGASTMAVEPSAIKNPLYVTLEQVKAHSLNQPVKVKALINGQPLIKKAVTVFSPEGWGKEFMTDENGMFSFQPIWVGRYVIEASNYEKKDGEHHGVSYDAVWQGATTSFEIAKR